ncbi:hypothetical protein [Ramlibacter sp.]|uniref:hypothetical protein n=1 Tax=Ramlibacter sp. TaxID=1917967 RepID=UPI003D121653
MNAPQTPYPVKQADLEGVIDARLIEWFEHFRNYTYGRKQGHRRSSTVAGDYQTPGYMDWANGADEEKAEWIRTRNLDEAVNAVKDEPQRWHTALVFNARNLHIGRVIWDSPRLPVDREEREILIQEARNLLATELHKRNLLK